MKVRREKNSKLQPPQRIVKRKRVPNAKTARAMKAVDEGKGKRFKSVDDLFRDLGI